MRTSKYLLYTLKKIPKNIDTISHKLMLRAGLIRQTHTGLYTWLPNGLKVLKKIKTIIRHEMNNINAIEMCFPIIQSKYLWQKSNRFNQYGKELIKFYDRHKNTFILSPTYEEMATEFIKKEIKSYKKFPIIIYQIQKKFRDEIRPRFGIIRAREFIMKDAYSFHNNINSLKEIYKIMFLAYIRIFKKINLKFYSVIAESGIMGGKYSHEFQALSKFGEDKVIIKKDNSTINNINLITNDYIRKNFYYKKKINIKNIYLKKQIQYNKMFYLMKKRFIKIYFLKNFHEKKNKFVVLMIRGDHTLSLKKIKENHILNIKERDIIFLNEIEIKNIIQDIQLRNIYFPIIIDINILHIKNVIPITIINDMYYNLNLINQNIQPTQIYDIIHQKTNKKYKIKNSIEIGHIFQIGIKYSKIIDLNILNKKKIKKLIYMGCYGIGVTRLIAAIIEQNHDKNGIIWPNIIAPFQLVIIPINIHQCPKIKTISETLYKNLKKKNIDVLLEDRNEQIGMIFSEINLIGIPNIIIINQNTIINNTIEYQARSNINKKTIVDLNKIYNFIINKLKTNK